MNSWPLDQALILNGVRHVGKNLAQLFMKLYNYVLATHSNTHTYTHTNVRTHTHSHTGMD